MAQAEPNSPDFSGKTVPVGSARAVSTGLCSSFVASFQNAAARLPAPLPEGGLWSPLILEQTEGNEYARFVSRSRDASTPDLQVLVRCQQLGNLAQLDVRTAGPLPLDSLTTVSERLLAALQAQP